MRTLAIDPKDTELAKDFTVRQYEAARDARQREVIADAIQRRFTERYVTPATTGEQHGFTMMAVACLMIEALESFHQGWETSERQSKAAFCFFFDRENLFQDFRGYGQQFYNNVRCGILHQAETTAGWKIVRENALFDSISKTINAAEFLNRLRQALAAYCAALKAADWDSPNWKKVSKQMKAICANCQP
jgi:hypothetical protein